MKAVAYQKPLPISDAQSLLDVNLPEPVPGERDLMVDVNAVSVNPVDTKMRLSSRPPEGQWGILGWDAVGIVRAVGRKVTLFKPGTGSGMPARSTGQEQTRSATSWTSASPRSPPHR